MLPLLAVWAISASVAASRGVLPEMIRVGSQVALVPLWFLAVYSVVVLLAPLTYPPGGASGMASFWLPGGGRGVAVDLARFGRRPDLAGLEQLPLRLARRASAGLPLARRPHRRPGALAALGRLGGRRAAPLVLFGPYPRSMVGVPGEEVSNTLPPSLAMLALGVLQAGLLLALERPARRWLARRIGPGPQRCWSTARS